MTCANCSATVESAVGDLPGVLSVDAVRELLELEADTATLVEATDEVTATSARSLWRRSRSVTC